jgi:hypothetical protein
MGRPRKTRSGKYVSVSEDAGFANSTNTPVIGDSNSNVALPSGVWNPLDSLSNGTSLEALQDAAGTINYNLDSFPFDGMSHSIPWSFDQTAVLSYLPQQCDQVAPSTLQTQSQTDTDISCNCISITSSALQMLSSLTTFHFPSSLGYLRNILSSLSSVISCNVCPQSRAKALQNALLLQTTFASLVERFQGLLVGLDVEHQRLVEAGTRPSLRIADPSVNLSLHTGTPDCPMGFTLEIEPKQWRDLAHKSLMSLLKGSGSNTLLELVRAGQKRQAEWHVSKDAPWMKGSPKERDGWMQTIDERQEPQCVVNLGQILKQVELMN